MYFHYQIGTKIVVVLFFLSNSSFKIYKKLEPVWNVKKF